MPDEPMPAPSARRPAAERPPERLAFDIALHIGLIALLAYLALNLLWPFGRLAVWTIIVAATLHPVYLWLASRLGGRRRLAATLTTAGALAIVLGPIAMLSLSLVASVEWVVERVRAGNFQLPDPPSLIMGLPVGIGKAVASNWELAATNLEAFLARYNHALLGAGEYAARPALHLATGTLVFIFAVALSGLMLMPGQALGAAAREMTGRLIGPRNARFVDIAGATIRNVARGVIGVGVIQALVIGVGLIAVGVPAAGLLTLAALVMSITQIGAWLVTLPVIAWAWLTRDTGTAVLLTAWMLPAGVIDVPLKPLLLGKSLATPRLVILAGVIGGMVSYGLIGLFVGPILLALAYEVLRFGLYGEAAEAPPRAGGIE